MIVATVAIVSAIVSMQCPDGTPPPCEGAHVRAVTPSANSVAVLYFEDVSRDTADAYLADGLTDEIILRLQQVRRLEVKSRFESQRVRGRRSAAPASLGRELAARYLVNGTIQRAGQRVVVRVELTQADRAVGIWSERFDRTSSDVLGVIDDIARGVATGVAGQLLPDEAASLAHRPTVDPVAYDHLVRGNVYLARRSPASLARAVEEYQVAFARDSTLTPALARVAYAYSLGMALGVGDLPPETVTTRAGDAIARAMRLAPAVPETWLAEGFRQFIRSVLGSGDYIADALAALAHAVQLDPGSAEAHHQYGQGLVIVGPDSAALAEYHRALELEPGRAVTCEEIARLLFYAGRLGEALAWADSAVTADSQLVRGYVIRARVRLVLGDVPGSDRDIAIAARLARGSTASMVMNVQAVQLAARGDTARARQAAAGASTRYTIYSDEMLVAIGEADRALADIAATPSPAFRCYRLRAPLVAQMRGQPRYDQLAAACPRR